MKVLKRRIDGVVQKYNVKPKDLRRCEVCNKLVDSWNIVLVHSKVCAEDERMGAFSNCEKEIRVCNPCKLNMNFRKWGK